MLVVGRHGSDTMVVGSVQNFSKSRIRLNREACNVSESMHFFATYSGNKVNKSNEDCRGMAGMNTIRCKVAQLLYVITSNSSRSMLFHVPEDFVNS